MTKGLPGSRRQFLLGAGATTAAAAAVVATQGRGVAPVPKTAGKGGAAGRGYQLTEHVRNYYRTTAV